MMSAHWSWNLSNTAQITPPSFDELYDGMGYFWTKVFKDTSFVKGEVLGAAETAANNYYQLIETLSSQALKDTPVFSLRKWVPLIVQKSNINQIPLRFQPNSAVFGKQPETDFFYRGVTFAFGFPRNPIAELFALSNDRRIAKCPLIANALLAPTTVLTAGVDFIIADDTIFFNKNLFDVQGLLTSTVLEADDTPALFDDPFTGTVLEDQVTILWMYQPEEDVDRLTNQYGVLLNIYDKSSEQYKNLLHGLFNIYVEGPTFFGTKSLLSTILQTHLATEDGEVVEQVTVDASNKYIVTDKHAYTIAIDDNIVVVKGDVLKKGQNLTDKFAVYDNIETPGWWRYSAQPTLSSSGLLLNSAFAEPLLFQNTLAPATLSQSGALNFPSNGNAADVSTFNNMLNTPNLLNAMGLTIGSTVLLNPVDFLFSTFLKTNTLGVVLQLTQKDLTANLFVTLNYLIAALPKNVFLIVFFNTTFETEEYNRLNNSFVFGDGVNVFTGNADGSDFEGVIPNVVADDFLKSLFFFSAGPELSLEEVTPEAGAPISPIPVGATTQTVPNLLLLDFQP